MNIAGLPFEIAALAAACFIGLVHVGAQSFSFHGQVGHTYAAGARDDEPAPAGIAGRLWRAQRNFGETFPLFAAAALAVVAMEKTGVLSVIGCSLYVGGRALYLPAYASGLPWVRTVVWQIATIGIVLVLAALLWPVGSDPIIERWRG